MPQFVLTRKEHATQADTSLWLAQQLPASVPIVMKNEMQTDLVVYECTAEQLWSCLPMMENQWLSDAVLEQGEVRHKALGYKHLSTALRERNVYLLVTLPSGFVQIVPRLRQGVINRKSSDIALKCAALSNGARFSRKQAPKPPLFVDMPFRHTYRAGKLPAAAEPSCSMFTRSSILANKRKAEDVDYSRTQDLPSTPAHAKQRGRTTQAILKQAANI